MTKNLVTIPTRFYTRNITGESKKELRQKNISKTKRVDSSPFLGFQTKPFISRFFFRLNAPGSVFFVRLKKCNL